MDEIQYSGEAEGINPGDYRSVYQVIKKKVTVSKTNPANAESRGVPRKLPASGADPKELDLRECEKGKELEVLEETRTTTILKPDGRALRAETEIEKRRLGYATLCFGTVVAFAALILQISQERVVIYWLLGLVSTALAAYFRAIYKGKKKE